jgi:hypothetical protein
VIERHHAALPNRGQRIDLSPAVLFCPHRAERWFPELHVQDE